MKSISFCIGALTFLSFGAAASDAQLWWERGADKWYYKDDWKGLALSGGKIYKKTIQVSIRYNVPIHCGEFGISMIQPDADGEAWLNDYLALFERFGIGWNWWNYSGNDIYRTGLAAGDRISPYVPILSKWMVRSGWGASRRVSGKDGND